MLSRRRRSSSRAPRTDSPPIEAPAVEEPPQPLLAFIVVALGYALAVLLVRPLALPPGFAVPLSPAAGVALIGVLLAGRWMLPAVALGAFLVQLALAWQTPFVASALTLPAAMACGATLQAFVGAQLIRHQVAMPLTLAEPRDVAAFLVSGVISCLFGTAVVHLGLWWTDAIPPSALLLSGATWAVGDLVGVLIIGPILLTVFGRPRAAWAPRLRSVGLTLVLATLMLALGIRKVNEWNVERMQTAFEHDAAGAGLALSAQLREPLSALDSLHSLFIASVDVNAEELQLATRSWLASGGLQAMAWSVRVPRDEVPAFEAQARAEGRANFNVFDRSDAGAVTTGDNEVIAVRLIEPLESNAGALGVNVLSIPATRAAIEAARLSDASVATAAFKLTQPLPGENQAVVVYRAIYSPRQPAPSQRMNSLRGMVSVTIRLDDQLRALAARIPSYLSLCLIDATPGAPTTRLAGPLDCDDSHLPMEHTGRLNYAGREWIARVSARPEEMPRLHGADAWLFAVVGLLSTTTLGAFLLTVTGRTYRIETAVRDRTAALRAEVGERETAEAALRESEQRFRNILNHVPIGVIYSDLRGNVKQTNPRFCELIGYNDREVLGLALSDYTHPEDMSQDAELLGQLVRGEIPMYRRHKRYIAKNKAIVWVQATVSLLRYADGKPRSVVGVVEDITEHLKLEEAERAREAAEASNRAKSEFLSRMSHELRTPLNAMLGFAQLLELDARYPLTVEQRPWVSQIQQAGWHLLEMINDVLDLSRIESGNLRLQTETLNLIDLLDATVGMVEGQANERGIKISRALADGTASAHGDSTRVKQILINLLTNAVKYNSDGGRIHVASRLVMRGEMIEIAVTDTGLGMTPQQLGELFQPFNRLGRERSTQQGTGIGLVISQRLAELMGGSLRARSVAGEGSSFLLTLPSATDPDTVPDILDEEIALPAEYHRRRVHYVEDNETNVEVMRGILAQRPQVEMEVSMTGMEGLSRIRADFPDLILLDMHLPDISGMELLRHLKADPGTAGIPVVVVSADATAQQIDAAFDAGCSHYLTKPVSVAELLGVLDDLLERMDTNFG